MRKKLDQLSPAFNLGGDGPLFLQDLEDLDAKSSPPDMLFIDSSGSQTAKFNADLMVRRDRYPALSMAEAAMALYTLQSQAPAGGAGNRTSMRGGGPLITLIVPGQESTTALWDMLWANVPDGRPVDPAGLEEALPWMRTTRTSHKGEKVQPPEGRYVAAEAFFGMPRRLRLDFTDGSPPEVIGVRQRPYGTNYDLWLHPLSPYYQQKEGSEWLPMHPRAGNNSYRNWEGISLERLDGLRHVAGCVKTWTGRSRSESAILRVGGWSMDNMKPRDFLWSEQPFVALSEDAEQQAIAAVEAAEAFALALVIAVKNLYGIDSMSATAIESVHEAFFIETQSRFESLLGNLAAEGNGEDWADSWRQSLMNVALKLFEDRALPELANRPVRSMETVIKAHGQLRAAFHGYGNKTGKAAFKALGLPLPKTRKVKEKTE